MIFISHADEDRQLARRLCEALERAGARCWIAPRDVRAGKSYPVEIMHGIEESDTVVLLLSEHANASSMVEREIERAVNKNRTVIPLRILGTAPAGALEFLLATKHWIDLGDAPVEQFVDQILGATQGPEEPRRRRREEEGAQQEEGQAAPERERQAPRAREKQAQQEEETTQGQEETARDEKPRANAIAEERGGRREEETTHKVPLVRRPWTVLLVAILCLGGVVLLAVLRIWQGHSMVTVPGGQFWMGCTEKGNRCEAASQPGRSVNVDAFSIDRTEVTVAQYRQCVKAGACEKPDTGGSCNWDVEGRDNHPINCVDLSQAREYCGWAGKRLPSEEEWEKAARGTDGREYPWGNRWSADKANAGTQSTTPVGSFPAGASPYGVLDMSGNVSEWVSDQFGIGHGLRGGSWNLHPGLARTSLRPSIDPGARNDGVGFRCAQ